jgi:hypothetical protein
MTRFVAEHQVNDCNKKIQIEVADAPGSGNDLFFAPAKVNDPVTMTIFKYKLEVGANRVSMPQDSRILTAAIQNGVIMLWALVVSPQDSCQDRLIMVYGTGWPIECWPGRYIATAISDTGAFVWHVFDATSPPPGCSRPGWARNSPR